MKKETIAHVEYNEIEFAMLNHNWKKKPYNSDGYECDVRMLLWLELLSNSNEMKSTNATRVREEKACYTKTNERSNQRANERNDRNNVRSLLFGQSSEKPHVTHSERIAAVFEKFRSLTISRSLSHPFRVSFSRSYTVLAFVSFIFFSASIL